MSIKIGVCDFALPGAGIHAPRIVHDFGLDGMSIEMGYEQHGYPISQPRMQKYYLEEQQKYSIEYTNIAMSDLDYHPIHAKPGTKNYSYTRKMMEIAVKAASAMGISTIMICCFNQSLIVTDEELERAADTIRYACDLAGEKGITVGCENALSDKRVRILFDLVNRKNIGIFYDSQNHQFDAGLNPAEELDKFFDLLIPQLHVKDGIGVKSGSLLGTGTTGFYEQMAVLKKHNYQGWFLLENYYDQEPLRNLNEDYFVTFQKDIDILRNAINW